MGKGQKLVTKKAPVEGSEDLFPMQDSQAIYSSSEEDDDVQIPVGEDDDDLTQIDDSQRREDSQRLEESTSTAPEPEILRPQRPQEPPKKRQRHYHMIGDQHEEGVVEWYRQHELLYNKKMRAYRDRDKKSQAWTTKAEELGVEGELCFKMLSNYFEI